MLVLSQINIYPIKSLDGYSPSKAVVERQGLKYDRRWMLIDEAGVFITQRTVGKMALLKAVIVADQWLHIYEKQNPTNGLKIALDAMDSTRLPRAAQVWDDTLQVQPVSAEADAWLSDFLGQKCCLVKMTDPTERRVDEDYNTGDDIVSFADGYPFLIIGEASLADLNARLEGPLSMRRFRPNFVFSGGQPFEEDGFSLFTIGEVTFKGVKKCGRCVLITRDPDSGDKGKEPLATLQTYRAVGNKILFGQNIVWVAQKWPWAWSPEVTVGDVLNPF